MSCTLGATSGQKHFVFINYDKNDRDPITKLSLINTHCALISHHRRNIRPAKRATTQGEDSQIYVARKPNRLPHQVLDDTGSIASAYQNSNIGKLRVGCIESYPPKHTPRLSRALEFYMKAMGPTGIWRPDILDAGATGVFRRKFFQLSISSPAITEIIMAIAQVHIQQFFNSGSAEHSHFILQHRGKALKGLRNALIESTSDSMDTALVLMMSLLILDSNSEDWISYEANLKGLRQFVKLKGGLGLLGWYGWAAWMTMWAELRWLGHLTQLAIAESATNGLKYLTYPDHPFPRKLCLDISKLPEGFTRLALSKNLSNDVVQHLWSVSQWSRGFRLCIKVSGDLKDFSIQEMRLANTTYTLLRTCHLKPIERLMCIGILTYIISFDANVPLERHPQYLKNYAPKMDLLFSVLPVEDQTNEALVWVATCIAAINVNIVELPAEEQWFLLDLILDRHCGSDNFETVWGDVWRDTSMFFHNEILETKWKECWKARWETKELARFSASVP